MNMIPRHASGLSPAEQTNDFLLIAGSTPASRWERILPLFERAGCTLPAPALLDEWYAVARGNAALGQPGVATLNPGALHQSLRSASSALLDACLSPVLLAVESLEARPEFWLEELPGARLLMFHTRPEAALIAAMEADRLLDDALVEWMKAAEGMLRTFRHHRRRIALIDVECVLAAPIDFLHSCRTWLGLQPLPYSAAAAAPARNGSDMQYLIAAQMVAQAPELGRLISELEACSLPIGEPASPPFVDCGRVYAEQRAEEAQRRILEEERIEYQRLAEERQARIEQAVCVHEENAARLQQSEGLLAEARAEHELLLKQLRQTQEELEAVLLKQLQYSCDSEELRREHQRLQSDLETLTAVRQTQAQLIGEREAQLKLAEQVQHEAAQENDFLLMQLHQVQEELESYYLRLQSSSSIIECLEKKLKGRENRIRYMKGGIERLERKLRGWEKRIRYMEGSRSWKITAPLRAVTKRFYRRVHVEGGAKL